MLHRFVSYLSNAGRRDPDHRSAGGGHGHHLAAHPVLSDDRSAPPPRAQEAAPASTGTTTSAGCPPSCDSKSAASRSSPWPSCSAPSRRATRWPTCWAWPPPRRPARPRPARRRRALRFQRTGDGAGVGCTVGTALALHRPDDDVGRERGLLTSGPCPGRRCSCRGRARRNTAWRSPSPRGTAGSPLLRTTR